MDRTFSSRQAVPRFLSLFLFTSLLLGAFSVAQAQVSLPASKVNPTAAPSTSSVPPVQSNPLPPAQQPLPPSQRPGSDFKFDITPTDLPKEFLPTPVLPEAEPLQTSPKGSSSPALTTPAGIAPSDQNQRVWVRGVLPSNVGKLEPRTSTTPDAEVRTRPLDTLEAVTLTGEQSQNLVSMVRGVLSASVVKIQEYPIELETVLKLIEAQNLQIQRDLLTSKIRKTEFYRSVSRLLPDITSTYSHSRFQGVIQIFGSQTIPVFQTSVVPQLTARWVVNPGGQDVFRALALKHRAQEAKFRWDQTIQEQLAQGAREYYNFVEAHVQVDNVKAGLAEAESQVALNEARFKAGVGTRLDLMRAKTQLVQKQTDLVDFENRVALAEQQLLQTLNLNPDVMLIPARITAKPQILIPLSVKTDALVARAMEHNPSLKAQAMALKAVSADSKATLSRIVPTVTLQTYINGTGPSIEQLGLSRFGGFVVQSNLFESLGTAIPLDYRTRRLEYHRQEVELQLRLREVQTQVINGFLDSRAAAQSMLTSQEELTTAEEAYRLSLGRFRAGLGINVDVLNAQTALTLARIRLTQAILSFNRAQVSLLEATGDASTDTLLHGVQAVAPATSSPNNATGKKSSP